LISAVSTGLRCSGATSGTAARTTTKGTPISRNNSERRGEADARISAGSFVWFSGASMRLVFK